jgi:CubicO group peptidase (beta-lactamase class C family)
MHCLTRESPSSRPGPTRRKFHGLLTLSTLLFIAACGGGGGGGSDPPTQPANPPPPPPSNAAPTVQAGADQSVELPQSASLQGSATDDGPASSLTYLWSGPAGVRFAAESSASTTASFDAAGSYTLTLTANDGTNSSSDTLVVTVNPAVFPGADPTNGSDPNHGWLRVTSAADVGMEQGPLDQAATYAQSTDLDPTNNPSAGMVVRRGRIVHSWGNIDRRFDLKSTTKSMGGIALGLALDENKVELTDAAATHLPNVGLDPAVTVLQLATHTAGFPKPGGFEALAFTPGTTFFYSDGGLNWLADVLTVAYQQDLSVLLNTRVWSKIGMVANNDIQWRTNVFRPAATRPAGFPANLVYRELAAGVISNVNSMARVGLLFLRGGMWNSERILSQEFVDIVRTPRPENAGLANPQSADFPGATADYGVLWWTNSSGQMANVPADTFWAWGLGESLIVVIPSLDLVIARAGDEGPVTTDRVWNGTFWNGDYAVLEPFLNPIVDSATP